jgi:two-component system chemotaxis response regulator CheB
MMPPIRVLIVDDSAFMRVVLRDIIAADPTLDIVGTATDGRDAVGKVDALMPDVVTMDIEMPAMNGIEALRRIRGGMHQPRILMLSSLTAEGAELTKTALSLGADDFMLKPRNIGSMRGIGSELCAKIHAIVEIPLQSSRDNHSRDIADRVVLIGASAGGPPMLDRIFSSLPPLPAAIVVTQHMPAGFTASLAERLNRIAPVPVKETENAEALRNATIYVSHGGYHSVIAGVIRDDGRTGGKILHSSSPPMHAVRPAVDVTFSTGAKTFGSRVFSVILSGMGNDGGAGTAEVKRCGGTTVVCGEPDCLVYGMARSALITHSVDQVVPLDAMAGTIQRGVEKMGAGYA